MEKQEHEFTETMQRPSQTTEAHDAASYQRQAPLRSNPKFPRKTSKLSTRCSPSKVTNLDSHHHIPLKSVS